MSTIACRTSVFVIGAADPTLTSDPVALMTRREVQKESLVNASSASFRHKNEARTLCISVRGAACYLGAWGFTGNRSRASETQAKCGYLPRLEERGISSTQAASQSVISGETNALALFCQFSRQRKGSRSQGGGNFSPRPRQRPGPNLKSFFSKALGISVTTEVRGRLIGFEKGCRVSLGGLRVKKLSKKTLKLIRHYDKEDSQPMKGGSGRWLWDASRQLRNQNLLDFWGKWNKFTVITPLTERYDLLIEMGKQVYQINTLGKLHNSKMRKRFNLLKEHDFEMPDLPCACCGAPSEIRHHIVPIKNGGHNHSLNLMQLCRYCHAEIHPWLKEV